MYLKHILKGKGFTRFTYIHFIIISTTQCATHGLAIHTIAEISQPKLPPHNHRTKRTSNQSKFYLKPSNYHLGFIFANPIIFSNWLKWGGV